ncbi:peptidylprolyl isomerase [Sediminibacterium goheungense]|uniref:peptidylprolyl isomerase n=1 Tax=Sediminibacterium goheungense TaxID=1086393 RepID=A0A4R6J1Q4_9BACT|nr:peptidylprolyl isomerase [Sediminibacterium goheungense]TDO29182.1 peptidyl-prolyl cis-trans isomerase B (cyclophilin B) [Sediminibacterium goheungense]
MHKLLLVLAVFISSCAGTKYFRKLDKEEKRAIKDNKKWAAVSSDEAHVLIMTTKGNMVVKLYNQTPLHRDNFLSKVNAGFYDSLLFHRVINRFMIQGGDPESKYATADKRIGGGSAPGDRIPAEFRTDQKIYHQRGALAMARTDNPEKASSNCQFYIVQRPAWRKTELDSTIAARKLVLNEEQKSIYTTMGGTPHLDGGYTVFGELLHGFEVLDSIAVSPTKSDRPLNDIRMRMFLLNKPRKK